VHYDPRDPWQVPMPFDGPTEATPIRVAFTRNTFGFALHPAVAQALDRARAALVAAGYEVHEVEPPLLEEAATTGARCLFGEAKALMDADVRRHGSKTVVAIFDEYYRYFQPFEGIEFLRAMADRNRFVRAWTTFMADYPLVLTPFLPAPIFTWNRDEQGAAVTARADPGFEGGALRLEVRGIGEDERAALALQGGLEAGEAVDLLRRHPRREVAGNDVATLAPDENVGHGGPSA